MQAFRIRAGRIVNRFYDEMNYIFGSRVTHLLWRNATQLQTETVDQQSATTFVSMSVYVCDYVRASVSGLFRPFLSCGFYPLNHSFIYGRPME